MIAASTIDTRAHRFAEVLRLADLIEREAWGLLMGGDTPDRCKACGAGDSTALRTVLNEFRRAREALGAVRP
jgi:hypothetical protein